MESVQRLGYMLQHVTDALHNLIDQSLQEQLGIGLAQYRVLTVFKRIETHTQRGIAEYLNQTEAGVSRQVKILEQKGILATKINARNRREHVCYLTPKGKKLAAAAENVVQHAIEHSMGDTSDKQRRHTLDTLESMHSKLCRSGTLTACNNPYEL